MTKPQEAKRPWGRALLALVVLSLVVVVGGWLVIGELSFAITWRLLNRTVDDVVNVSGLSRNLVRGILLIAAIPFGLALSEVLRLPLPFTRSRGRYRRSAAKLVLILYVSGYFITLHLVSRGSRFTMAGEAIQWYCASAAGVHYFSEPGVCPQHGLQLQAVTPDLAVAIDRREAGLIPDGAPCEGSIPAFDVITGEAKLWYLVGSDNEIRCFDGPGYDPLTGATLAPITPDVVLRIQEGIKTEAAAEAERLQAEREQAEREGEVRRREAAATYRSRFIDASVLASLGDSLVVGFDDSALDASVRRHLRELGVATAPPLFRPEFFGSSEFSACLRGDMQTLASLGITRASAPIVIGASTVEVSPSRGQRNLLTATGRLSGVVLLPEKGPEPFVIELSAAGFSDSAARGNATRRLVEALLREPVFLEAWK